MTRCMWSAWMRTDCLGFSWTSPWPALRILGELLRLGPKDITHLYELNYSVELHRRLLREGQAICELSHVARDGRRLPIEVKGQLFTFKGARAVLCIARDISVNARRPNSPCGLLKTGRGRQPSEK